MGVKLNGATSGSVELGVPAAVGSDINFTLPGADGTAGQYLKTNGSGALSFDSITSGKVLQVVYNQEQTGSSVATNATSWSEITDLATSITPIGTNSKFYVQVRWNGELSSITNWDTIFAAGTSNPPSQHLGFNMGVNNPAGSSIVFNNYHGGDALSTPDSTFYSHLFDGLGNSTFTMRFYTRQSGNVTGTLYTNRTVSDTNGVHFERLSSSMIIWEIAA